jgi:hypothetical protein
MKADVASMMLSMFQSWQLSCPCLGDGDAAAREQQRSRENHRRDLLNEHMNPSFQISITKVRIRPAR